MHSSLFSNAFASRKTSVFLNKAILKKLQKYRLKFALHKSNLENISQLLMFFFDKIVFGGKLKNRVLIFVVAKDETNAATSVYHNGMAGIVLSKYYLTKFNHLCDTLLHEMCHCAQWLISGNLEFGKKAHNAEWHKWRRRCRKFFPSFPVEVFHNYS